MSLSEPLNARPMGLRAVETMTASDMIPFSFVGQLKGLLGPLKQIEPADDSVGWTRR
jgi:hypothetical protein